MALVKPTPRQGNWFEGYPREEEDPWKNPPRQGNWFVVPIGVSAKVWTGIEWEEKPLKMFLEDPPQPVDWASIPKLFIRTVDGWEEP